MNLKDNKGVTGTDVAIAIVILMIFVSLISGMFYNIAVTSKRIERKSIATNLAVAVIEEMKVQEFDELTSTNIEGVALENYAPLAGKVSTKEGYTTKVVVTDPYGDNLVKKVSVKVEFKSSKSSSRSTDDVSIETLIKNVQSDDEEIGINVGDYIDYSPDDTAQTTYSKDKLAETITGSSSNSADIRRDTLKWQVLKINEDGSMDIIGTPTSKNIYLNGALGYNNGVYVINDICKTLYSRSGIEARSVNIEDFEYWLEQAGQTSVRDDYIQNDSNIQYNNSMTYKNIHKNFPYLYQYEKGAGIGSNTVGKGKLGVSQTYINENGYKNGVTENTSDKKSGNLTVTQTYWTTGTTETNFGNGSNALAKNLKYWVASRYVLCDDIYAFFGLNSADTAIGGWTIFTSKDNTETTGNGFLRPVVTLKSSTQIEKSSTASDENGVAHHITQY